MEVRIFITPIYLQTIFKSIYLPVFVIYFTSLEITKLQELTIVEN